jgi:pyrroline-5-carboxylate reductase
MKVTIIGGGNMGGAIARGLAKGSIVKAEYITVSDPFQGLLDALKADCPEINVTNNNEEAIVGADIVMLAVKPWLVEKILSTLNLDPTRQIFVPIAAGIGFDKLSKWVAPGIPIFRVMPNTGILHLESMSIVASYSATKEQEQLVLDLFNEMGVALLMPEENFPAATALASCGIAYVLKYIQAAMQAGIELGLYPQTALELVAQSVKGAATLIQKNHSHPSVEIDKVTTPGGITIKGINALDHGGFTSAIINAMKVSCVK